MSSVSGKNTQPSANPEKWIDLYGQYLFNYALGRLRNPEQAENMVQETFCAALTSQGRFAGISSERTWLVGILKHKIMDHFRKQYREKPVTDLQENDEAVNSFFDHTGHLRKQPSPWLPDPQALLENKEFREIFHVCLQKLPAPAHDAFTLREIEKLDSKEVCQILNITPSDLWVILHRDRLYLRQCLKTNWFEK